MQGTRLNSSLYHRRHLLLDKIILLQRRIELDELSGNRQLRLDGRIEIELRRITFSNQASDQFLKAIEDTSDALGVDLR